MLILEWAVEFAAFVISKDHYSQECYLKYKLARDRLVEFTCVNALDSQSDIAFQDPDAKYTLLGCVILQNEYKSKGFI